MLPAIALEVRHARRVSLRAFSLRSHSRCPPWAVKGSKIAQRNRRIAWFMPRCSDCWRRLRCDTRRSAALRAVPMSFRLSSSTAAAVAAMVSIRRSTERASRSSAAVRLLSASGARGSFSLLMSSSISPRAKRRACAKVSGSLCPPRACLTGAATAQTRQIKWLTASRQ